MKKKYSFLTSLLVWGLLMFPFVANAQAPLNDDCPNAIALACNSTVSGSTTNATIDTEVNGTACGTFIDAPGVWYIVEGTGGILTASTCNQANYDTKISVFTGSCGSLVCEGGLDDTQGCAGFTTEFTWMSTLGTTYYVLIHGFNGQTGDFDLTVTCEIPPEIEVYPDNFTFLVPLEGSDADVMTITNTAGSGANDLTWMIRKSEATGASPGGSTAGEEPRQTFLLTDQILSMLSSNNVSPDVINNLRILLNRSFTDKQYFAEMLQKTIGEEQYAVHGMTIMQQASNWETGQQGVEMDLMSEKYACAEEDKNRPIVPAPMLAGGSDAFGYGFIDSDETGGPAFSWTDITTDGTEIITNLDWDNSSFGNADDADKIVTLPFTFHFYGVPHTAVRISSNGYLTFGTDGINFSNDPIPDPITPNDIICPFWDDINPADGGTIHYKSGVDQFIVQYTGVPLFLDLGTSLTFQVILNADGSILYQYLSMTGTLNSASIGIENSDASIGLNIASNTLYVHDNLAVLIEEVCTWMSPTPRSGATPQGTSDDVNVNVDAAGLPVGTFVCNLVVDSDAANESSLNVPVTMYVGTPLERIDDLIAKVEALEADGVLNKGQANAFIVKLNAAKKSIEKGYNQTAVNQLNAFINQVMDFMDEEILTAEQGNELIDCANQIIFLLENYPNFKSGSTQQPLGTSMVESGFTLEQNYPNPFDGSTNISFTVAASNLTTLKVYNALGQEVAVLFEEVAQADTRYRVSFDGSDHPKGVYFYHLKSGEAVDTVKKMILVE
jgi:hypothetical protein